MVFLFSFMFILDECLRNHSKSQRNYKIENLILLDSTWVDLYSEHMIWYNLVKLIFLLLDIYFFVINLYLHFSLVQLRWNFYGGLIIIFLSCGKNFMFIGSNIGLIIHISVPLNISKKGRPAEGWLILN